MASSAAALFAEREVVEFPELQHSHAAVLALLGKAVPLLTKAREVMEGVEVMTRQVERAKDAQCIALTAQKNMLAGEIPEASYKSKLLFAKDACVNVTGQAQKLNDEIRELETRWDDECQEEAYAAEDWLAINLKEAEAELDACRRVLGNYVCASLSVAAFIFLGLVHILAALLRLEGWEPGSLGPLLAGKLAFCKWWWTTVPARIAEINSARSNMVDPILEVREQVSNLGVQVKELEHDQLLWRLVTAMPDQRSLICAARNRFRCLGKKKQTPVNIFKRQDFMLNLTSSTIEELTLQVSALEDLDCDRIINVLNEEEKLHAELKVDAQICKKRAAGLLRLVRQVSKTHCDLQSMASSV